MNKNFIFQILDYITKNIVDLLLVTSFIFIILIIIVKLNINIENQEGLTVANADKKVNNMDDETIENIDEEGDNEQDDDDSRQFCKLNQGETHVLEEKCNKLHNDSCKVSGCCVLAKFTTGETKCVAGTRTGPTYMSDENQNMHEIDQYYYQNKCYGNDC